MSVQATRSALVAAAVVIGVLLLWALKGVVILVAFAVLLAYVLEPVVHAIECIRFPRGYRLPRPASAAAVMLGIVIGGICLANWAAPRLLSELGAFVKAIPSNAYRLVNAAHEYVQTHGDSSGMDPALQSLQDTIERATQNVGGVILGWMGRVVSGIGQIVGLALLPLLAYYLLAERDDVKASVLGFLPERAHPRFQEVLAAVNRALHSYVRGQALVSLIMGTAVGIALALLRFPGALLLGVMVGVAEVLPYIGFMLAATAITLTGFGIDLLHAAVGLGAYTLINWTIGMFVTPRVMGRHLRMHPFVVTVSVLAGAELIGPPGAMLALPAAAVLQSLVEEFAPSGSRSARGHKVRM